MSATITVEKRKLEKPPLELHYLGDRVLRQPAKRIAKVDDSIRQLAREMLQTMYSSNGIGLAAPQVAVNKQLIVIDCEHDKPENPPLILINPQIIGYGRELCKAEEGRRVRSGGSIDPTPYEGQTAQPWWSYLWQETNLCKHQDSFLLNCP